MVIEKEIIIPNLDREKEDLIKIKPLIIDFLQIEYGERKVGEILVNDKNKDLVNNFLEKIKKKKYFVKEIFNKEYNVFYIGFSKNITELEEYVHLRKKGITQIEDIVVFGKLMGYPDVSIKNFALLRPEKMLSKEDVMSLIGFDYTKDMPFKMCKENIAEQIEYLRNNYKIIIEKSPEILNIYKSDKKNKERIERIKDFIKNGLIKNEVNEKSGS